MGHTINAELRDFLIFDCRIDFLFSIHFLRSGIPPSVHQVNMPLLDKNLLFTGQPETHTFAGILFDMDGIIVDSTDAIVKHWHKCVLLGRALSMRCISAYCL